MNTESHQIAYSTILLYCVENKINWKKIYTYITILYKMAGVKLQDEEIFQDYGSRGRKQTKMDAMVKFLFIFWYFINCCFYP